MAYKRQTIFRLPEAFEYGTVRGPSFLQLQTGLVPMQEQQQVYRLKVDSSGRVALPAEARDRHHIAHGDTVVIVDDRHGLHIKTLDQVIAEVQAEFAKHVPRGVLLSDEINAERRSEIERD
jgi:AbrB family looped-hinge helix DNA binding protein